MTTRLVFVVGILVACVSAGAYAIRPPSQEVRFPDHFFTKIAEHAKGPKAQDICPNHNLVPVDIHASDISGAISKIEQYSQLYLKQMHAAGLTLGLSVGIVSKNKTLWTGHYGTVNMSTQEAPTDDSIWRLGSVTKIFTSLLLMKAKEQGIVHMDDSVSNFYNNQHPPALSFTNPYSPNDSDITLHMLSTHTSGLPREAPCTQTACTEDSILQTLNGINLMWPQYTQPHYSNLGISLLGQCLARAMGTPYEHAVLDMITKLGMTSSGFNFTDEVKARMPVGYTFINKQQVPDPSRYAELGWSAPCGGMYASLTDMLKFLQFFLTEESGLLQSHKAEDILPGFNNPDGTTAFGLGTWEDYYLADSEYWSITKSGVFGGFGSNIAFVPQLGIGMVTVVNLITNVDNLASLNMKTLVPAVIAAFANKQPTPSLPTNYKIVLGSFAAGNMLVQPSATQGVLTVTILHQYTYNATYEPIQNVWKGKQTFAFRLSLVGTLANVDCLTSYSLPSGVIYFYVEDGVVFVDVPDYGFYQIAKD